MRRWITPALAITLLVTLLVASPTPVGAAGPHFATSNFADQAHMVTLAIPTPACRHVAHTTSCNWELFVDEPDQPGRPVVGAVFGTSGVLSVPYPTSCGVLQADALVVGSPPHKEVGYRHQINTCHCLRPLTPQGTQSAATDPQFAHIEIHRSAGWSR